MVLIMMATQLPPGPGPGTLVVLTTAGHWQPGCLSAGAPAAECAGGLGRVTGVSSSYRDS